MRSSRVVPRAIAVACSVAAFAVTAVVAIALTGGKDAPDSLSLSGNGARQKAAPAHIGADARHPAGVARCANAQMRTAVRGGGRLATYSVVFTNVSHTACWLRGYPTVSGHGAAERRTFGVPPDRRLPVSVVRVLLAPGGSAHANVDARTDVPSVGPVLPGA